MATLLDLSAFGFFVPLLSFLLIFFILYAILERTKILGGKGLIDFFVAMVVTLLVILNEKAVTLTNFISIWSAVILVILVFLFILFFGWAKDGDLGLPEDLNIKSLVFWIFIGILVIGITQVFGPVFTPYAEGADEGQTVLRTIFHPRLIGALVLVIIVGNLAKLLKGK